MGNSVSVIIPTWNRVKLLDRAIRSCLSQTVPVLEILVCDDGSTDGTEDLVRNFNDPRVKWCPGGHDGRPAIPRNRGIRSSLGEWVAFLDDDDEWLPEKVERQILLAEKLNCTAVCSNAYRVLPKNDLRLELLLRINENRLSFPELLQLNQVVCSSAMIRKEIFSVVGGFPEQPEITVGEDYALWLRVATQTDFAFVEAPLIRYFDDPHNSIRRGNDDFVQTQNVFKDFLIWADTMTSLRSYFKLVKVRLRELHKKSFRAHCKICLSKLFGRAQG